MRRPNMCNNTVGVVDETCKPASEKEESRLSRMRRVLGGGFRRKENATGGGSPSTTPCTSSSVPKSFGVPLLAMPLANHSIPRVLYRICSFIEVYGMDVEDLFRMSGGTPSIIDQLKSQFNSEGDAELENCDVNSVCSLLKLWLKELPEPLLPDETTSELVVLMQKYEGDSWWGPVCYESIYAAGQLRMDVLSAILSLLFKYTSRHPQTMSYIPGVFSALLMSSEIKGMEGFQMLKLTSKLIQDYRDIFNKRELKENLENIKETTPTGKLRKRKDRHESLRKERKFVRSNSEERPAVKPSCGENRSENMRRVSSHEDFSKTRHPNTHAAKDHHTQARAPVEPLHEHNVCVEEPEPPGIEDPSVGYQSALFDENEHERRRDSERFAPTQFRSGSRHRVHRAKHHKRHHAKENDFIIERPKVMELVEPEEASRDEEPPCLSPLSGVCSPTLDLKTFADDSTTDPIPCQPWTNIGLSDERMVSPRSSVVVSRRVFTSALSSGSAGEEADSCILDISTQINNLKRKLKKYDEGFEREFGYKPTHADRLANPDTRRMCSMLSKLRKQLKYVKEEISRSSAEKKKTELPALKEDYVREIEKRLAEKRAAGGRGESLETMTSDQLIEEKTAMQKTLLQLEGTFGRPQSREARDLVRPLYDRYRLLKRILLRNAPSKMKDSISELGTIHEHETMEFNSSPPLSSSSSPPRMSSPGGEEEQEEDDAGLDEANSPPVPRLDNLHALPRTELVELQRNTREEKKTLRRTLREYEVEFQTRTGRKLSKDEKHPLQNVYTNYKNTKAKLKLIDALLQKKPILQGN